MTPRDEATLRQIAAAAPDRSTWLAANAGSGKTRVLTDRVARLLLADVSPMSILCLTYTKAAASEMQNRLFRRLGGWAMLDDAGIDAALAGLGLDVTPDAALRAKARRLFARAIETPGGLRIQTIHSFCASVLRRFPMEAGVSPAFVELDDRAARLLQDDVFDRLAETDPEGIVSALAVQFTGAEIDNLFAEILSQRETLATVPDRDALLAGLGQPAGLTMGDVLARVFLGGEAAMVAALAPMLQNGGKTDQKLLDALEKGLLSPPGPRALGVLEDQLLFGEKAKTPFGPKIDSLPTKDVRRIMGEAVVPLHALMVRVADARAAHRAVALADRTMVLRRFAALFLRDYAALKSARGLLDFDDLVLRTRNLLADRSLAQWVLYRLDGGIDHILVDEAQDTSPVQWQVIEQLTGEFASTEQAHADRRRTLFVVGDKKQSIYSFMGADLRTFDRMRDHFRARFTAAGAPFAELPMEHSFRSSAAVLALVDHVMPPDLRGALGGTIRHLPFHAAMPGRVDLWPPLPQPDKPADRDWFDPVDIPNPEDAEAQLANRIAGWIKTSCDAGVRLPAAGDRPERAMVAGDVLVLVRKRSRLFAEIIRACKAADLPIAGADRLKLGGELAVRDLGALLAFLATPEDDLSLAAVLRSPLCGWSEDALYRLAQPRPGHLWGALRQAGADHPDTVAMLRDLRDQADFLRPYDLLERILTRHDGRRRLIARLGAEAEEGIDSLLSQALAQERTEVPSLTGLLAWLEQDDVEVKRRLDGQGPSIRVMTVHGAKGLESPVVILPDTALRGNPPPGALLEAAGTLVWAPTRPGWTPELVAAGAARRTTREEEELRLLYVALTRAESWLIVAAAGTTVAKPAKEAAEGETADRWSWHGLVAEGLRLAAAGGGLHLEGLETPTGWGQRLSHGAWPANDPAQAGAADSAGSGIESESEPPLPDWVQRPPPPRPRPAVPLAASALGGEKVLALPGLPGALAEDHGPPRAAADGAEQAMAMGTALHLLLERLPDAPRADHPRYAQALLADSLPPPLRDAVIATAARLLDDPALAPVFAPGTLAEVAISATLPALGGLRVHGVIDRLLPGADTILAVDYKTNAAVPATAAEVPQGILQQMGAYAAALEQIYPGRRVTTAILWTATGHLMVLPPEMVGAALRAATTA